MYVCANIRTYVHTYIRMYSVYKQYMYVRMYVHVHLYVRMYVRTYKTTHSTMLLEYLRTYVRKFSIKNVWNPLNAMRFLVKPHKSSAADRTYRSYNHIHRYLKPQHPNTHTSLTMCFQSQEREDSQGGLHHKRTRKIQIGENPLST